MRASKFWLIRIIITGDHMPGQTLSLLNWRRKLTADPARTTPGAYRRCTGRAHPRVAAMHSAYGKRRR